MPFFFPGNDSLRTLPAIARLRETSKMKVDDVPQEGLPFKDRDKLRKLVYATDKDGNYTGIPSVGWEAENTVTEGAWIEVEEALRETIADVQAGRLSPIAYYMQQRLMDLPLLARYAGKWQWTVKRHMKPDVFAKLSAATLQQYADIFEVSIEKLKAPDLR